jgi:molecular chaperone HscC
MAMIVGIDLGTTNSSVAVSRDGVPLLIPNGLGSVLTPSVVGLDDEGRVVVGETAKQRLLTHPDRTIACAKRYMGTDRRLELGGSAFRPEEVSALILRSLKEDAERFLGEPVHEAVITVPAYFNDVQRKATSHAGHLAGLRVERLLNEPTAAALAYGLTENDDRTFLMFDLGGGTFDVSVLEMFDGVIEVRASTGDNHLGGEDFTAALIDHLSSLLPELSPDARAQLRTQHLPRLYAAAEAAKHRLTAHPEAGLSISIDGRSHELSVTREGFEVRCERLLERLGDPIRRALRDSKIQPEELDSVILVGGATRMPMVQKLVTRIFGRFPEHRLDPDQVVAMGAAVQAALKQRDQALRDIVLTDVCPYSLGISARRTVAPGVYRNDCFCPIIERNTTVPVSRQERYATVSDDQTEILVRIYQGESIDVADNILLGHLEIPVPKAPAGQAGIDVRFSYDVNGLLEVDVASIDGGARKTLLIKGNQSNLSDIEIAASLERLRVLKVHPRENEVNLVLVYRAKRLYELLLQGEREAVAEQLARFESVLDTQDERVICAARRDFDEFLSRLSE